MLIHPPGASIARLVSLTQSYSAPSYGSHRSTCHSNQRVCLVSVLDNESFDSHLRQFNCPKRRWKLPQAPRSAKFCLAMITTLKLRRHNVRQSVILTLLNAAATANGSYICSFLRRAFGKRGKDETVDNHEEPGIESQRHNTTRKRPRFWPRPALPKPHFWTLTFCAVFT